MGCSERKTEIRRRRHRRKKVAQLKRKLSKATVSEKTEIARKLHELTPGAGILIQDWELVEADR